MTRGSRKSGQSIGRDRRFQSIGPESLTSEKVTLLGIRTGTRTKFAAQPQSQRQYVKDTFYVNLSQNRRKVKVKGVYVDVINIYGYNRQGARDDLYTPCIARADLCNSCNARADLCSYTACISQTRYHRRSCNQAPICCQSQQISIDGS